MDPDEVTEDGSVSITVGEGVSRRSVMKQLGAAGAAVGLAGCQDLIGGDGSAADGDGGDGDDGGDQVTEVADIRHPMVAPPGWDASRTAEGAGDETRTCVFVIQNVANEFFIPLTVGFHDALNQFGWEGELTGPTEQSVADQVDILDTVIDDLDEGDAIVTTILDESAYIEPIQKAFDNDVAVINGHTTPAEADFSYDYQRENFSYNGQDMVVPHVGILDTQGGYAMAAEAYDRMQSKLDKDEYTVLMTNELPENPSVTRRVDPGARSFFDQQDDVEVHDLLNPAPDVAEAQDQIVTTVQGNDIDAVVCSAFWGAVGAGNALNEGSIEGPMVVCGFDLVEPLLNGIDDGNIDFTVGQDPYGQGFMSVVPLWMYLNRGIEMKDIEWGVSVVDRDNVEFALERRSWSTLLEWQENNYEFLG